MEASKLKVSSSEPCKICGKPDMCYRLDFGPINGSDGGMLHCCGRILDRGVVIGIDGEYLWKKQKETNIGPYGYYEFYSEYKTKLEVFKKTRGKNSSYENWNSNSRVTPVKPHLTSAAVYATVKGEDAVASADKLDAVYRRLLDLLLLETWHIERLKKDWNTSCTGDIYTPIMSRIPIKSLPPADWVRRQNGYCDCHRNNTRQRVCETLSKEFDLTGVPGLYCKDGKWGITGSEGILFPIFNKNGKIVRLRLREDYPETKGVYKGVEGTFIHSYTKEGKHLWVFTSADKTHRSDVTMSVPLHQCPKGKAAGKYKNFNSVHEEVVETNGQREKVNVYGRGARSGSHISLYCKPTDDFSVVYVTEGEKKAIVANQLMSVPVISLPGTGTFSKLFEKDEQGLSMMDFLVSKGMKLCVIAYDADKGENIRVLQSEQKAIQEFIKRGLKVAIGEWNANWGKGLDDTLVRGIHPSIYLCS